MIIAVSIDDKSVVAGLRPSSQTWDRDRIDSAIYEIAHAGVAFYADATSTNGFQSKEENALLDAIRLAGPRKDRMAEASWAVRPRACYTDA